MSTEDIIRAWEDRTFFASLSAEQRALLPENPIGDVLSQEELVRHMGPEGQMIVASAEGSCCNTDNCGTSTC